MLGRQCAAVLMVLATAAANTACDPSGLGGPAKSCDLGFMPTRPHPTGPRVIAVAWANCMTPPANHTFTVRLQYKPRQQRGGDWHTADEQISTDIPPAPPKRLILELGAPCQPGRWRGLAHAHGTLNGTPFDFTDTSIERIVSEQDCQKRG